MEGISVKVSEICRRYPYAALVVMEIIACSFCLSDPMAFHEHFLIDILTVEETPMHNFFKKNYHMMLHQGEGCSMFMLNFMETREFVYIKAMAEMINQSPAADPNVHG